MNKLRTVVGLGVLFLAACANGTTDDADVGAADVVTLSAAKTLIAWNGRAVDAAAADTTSGPARAARSLAIVHIAVYDAVQSIAGTYQPYTGLGYDSHANMAAAIGQAAHDTLVALYPSQAAGLDAALASELAGNPAGTRDDGIARGKLAASRILALRANDGAETPDPDYSAVDIASGEGQWSPDAITADPRAQGAFWGRVKPFTMTAPDQFRAPAPNAVGTPAFEADLAEVAARGGNGTTTTTSRTPAETQMASFWNDASSPRLFNRIANAIGEKRGYSGSPIEMSRLLVMVHVGLADAGIACWESKYEYDRWRPTNAVRASVNPTFSPLGTTPPSPSYPSENACFGGALFGVLDHLVGDTTFTVKSDASGTTRTWQHLRDAETESARSQVLLGVSVQNDGAAGLKLGNRVGDQLGTKFFGRRSLATE